MDEKVYDEPTTVEAEDGKVILDGPDGVAVRMTPDAALETSDRLLLGASQAMGQRIQEEQRHKRREPPPDEAPSGA
jgi:hypothetical protein